MQSIAFARPVDWPSSVAEEKTFTLDITSKLFNQMCSYLTCLQTIVTSTILYNFQLPGLGRGSQGQRQSKPPGFSFLHTLQLIRMKLDMALKQFKLNILKQFVMIQNSSVLQYFILSTRLLSRPSSGNPLFNKKKKKKL